MLIIHVQFKLTYENFEIILGAVAIEGCYYAAWTGQINQIHMF